MVPGRTSCPAASLMLLLLLPYCRSAAYGGFNARPASASRRSLYMSALLHVYEPDSSSELSSYLDRKGGALPVSFEEAPKLSYSIAMELDESLDGETLPLSGGIRSIGLTVIISDVEDMDAIEACLSAFGEPEAARLESRDFDADRLTGFCCAADGPQLPTVTLINGESVAGFQAAPSNLQAILDTTATLADELEDHFEFIVSDPSLSPAPIMYGGRAPDGCLVGVLGMR